MNQFLKIKFSENFQKSIFPKKNQTFSKKNKKNRKSFFRKRISFENILEKNFAKKCVWKNI